MYSETYLDQVEKKKQRLEKITTIEDNDGEKSSLPTRMELHHAKKRKKKKKKKANFPLLKVLLTFFILLPVCTILAYTYFSQHPTLKADTNSNSSGGEEVLFESDSGDSTQNSIPVGKPDKNSNETSNSVDQGSGSNTEINPDNSTKGTTTVQNTTNNVEQANQEQKNSDNTEQVSNTQTNENSNIQIINHVVQPKETLFRIAMKYYHSKDGIEKIIMQNHIINNQIQAGQTLQIPLPK
ncbi:hypothetical protein AN964_09290 [Heyndrickxia shackletonii]|uniref:LysM domain-containing protein n=1 Tax=Heyndrickxia shackletonii TaxID=157838 RepID=A0A0Q3WWJ3_9BACI|nr:LysM peptidoglycan-binding domain-containing protein [Heyndrickxia shackletonii]KQL53674.1 hypothetical protein AN964_09290 [Heyndrickxia shackletonii]MBB2480970.1 LysM peptidoglycan-binding domain-containing protein [Bacillus sp. APMAM]NEY99811.1 LysM peptidoglycan-binding domain-containing protein [Heyndrickxia shackletonii]RTZ55674.1 LysM peptidoglycan-binding domain-containing protein [Bacillus sp. SAJ1]